MTAIGGSLESVNIGGRPFPVAADAEVQRKIGGFENEVQANGDGSARIIKTRMPLKMEGVTLVIDDSRGDHEYLQDLANSPDFFNVNFTYVSGITWQGRAQITGDFQSSSQNATASATFEGPGVLTRQ
jgi:hypothetical protein